jgi:hypothetical protein
MASVPLPVELVIDSTAGLLSANLRSITCTASSVGKRARPGARIAAFDGAISGVAGPRAELDSSTFALPRLPTDDTDCCL